MQTKTKHFLNAILVAIFTTFVCCAVFLLGGLVKPEELASSEQPKVQNTLTLESDFSNNKYVIVGGKVYLYNSAETQTTGLTSSDVAIRFDANNKLELIFMEDNVNALSSFAVSEEKIASILTAEKKGYLRRTSRPVWKSMGKTACRKRKRKVHLPSFTILPTPLKKKSTRSPAGVTVPTERFFQPQQVKNLLLFQAR